MNYWVKEEEADMIVNLVSQHLTKKKDKTEFECIALDICAGYLSSMKTLSDKQQNVVGAIYYRQVFKYKKPINKKLKIDIVKRAEDNDLFKKPLEHLRLLDD